MMARIEALKQRINKLAQRERIILAIALVIGVSFLWLQLAITPLQQQIKRTDAEITTLQSDMAPLANQIATLRNELERDPNQPLRQRIQELEHEEQTILAELKQSTEGLIEPKSMPLVLEELLQRNRKLKLIKLHNLDTTAIEIGAGSEEEGAPVLYRHAMALQLEGSYADTARYLKALEELPWKFFWESFKLDVTAYPTTEINIEIYTISMNREWIGV